MIHISTPGRICLFGEHQDYLGLPVIAAANSRRIHLRGQATPGPRIRIRLPDIGREESFSVSPSPLPYTRPRDYFRSGYNVLLRQGLRFSQGAEAAITGNIPINSGTSSSSALLVSWLHFLSKVADEPRDFSQEALGRLAYEAEVLEFNEPGGMIDQLSTAVGQVAYIEFEPQVKVEALHPRLGAFVLGDSQQPKDTLGVLQRAKFARLELVKKIQGFQPDFSLVAFEAAGLSSLKNKLTPDEFLLLEGTLTNRDLLRQMLTALQTNTLTDAQLGQALTAHHAVLREVLGVSTPKIENMLNAALAAGAAGGKINGSGGGGCMFAYAPENPEAVAAAIEAAGGRAYVIAIDEGTRSEGAKE